MRFEHDVIEDYLEATHAVGNHLLETFDKACTATGIPYYLTSGTLLGAVRSGDWIPWDDDVDVIMFREDYERLAPVIGDHLPANVAFSAPEARENHITVIPRLLYLDSQRIHVGRHRSVEPIETKHIPLDIFILDEGPRHPRLRRAWSLTAHGLEKAAVARYTSIGDVLGESEIGPARRSAELVGVVLSRVLSIHKWRSLREWLIRLPKRRESGQFVAVNYSTARGRRMTFDRDWYLPAGSVEFAGRSYPAPGRTHDVLTELYGASYATPPPESDRQPVHIRGGLEVTLQGRHWKIGPDPEAAQASPKGSFGHQVAWSLVARGTSALLQILTLVLLARGLAPGWFAATITVNVMLQVTVAVNGFGLLRQIEVRRSRDRDDPMLGSLFSLRLAFSYASAVAWIVLCLVTYAMTDSVFALALLPAAFWLLVEQTTQVWNGISVVDGHTRNLVGSYLTRRLPVVVLLIAALVLDRWMVPAWTLGMAAGSVLSYLWGYPGAEQWARRIWPSRGTLRTRIPFDLGYWWGLVGQQLRDFDVAAVHAVSDVISGAYAFPARLVAPMNLVTVAAASSLFPRVARGGLTRRHLRLGLTAGLAPVALIAASVALAAPLLPVILGDPYEASIDVMRVACLTAVFSGAGTMIGFMVQGHSTASARIAGYITLGFAALQILAAAVGANLGGAVLAAAFVAAVNALLAMALYLQAHRVAVP
ncbi:LicD family protein [Nocardioides sp.]|uniref:LicD family protein n=1 Tax=Nocardioides sp. TaxID=35761 RepID=UPI003568B255